MREDLYVTILDTKYCPFRYVGCNEADTEVCDWKCKRCDGMNYLMALSNLPKKYRRHQDLDYDLLTDGTTVKYLQYMAYNIEYFVKNAFNVYFYGDTGTGKTSWAVKMLTNYFSAICDRNGHNVSGLFISVPQLLRDIKYYMTKPNEDFLELIESIKTADLVVWDDILQTSQTAFESQWVYSFINDRLMNCKSNIYTSNVTPDELKSSDARLHSRVCTESDCLLFSCNDLRGSKKYSQAILQTEKELNN